MLLARLLALPANVLVLDEPTNDLDIDTLELLEELLQSYAGTVFLVSHDRRFLDNVVTSTIAWEGDVAPALWREYEGGYEDWKLQRGRARRCATRPSARTRPRRKRVAAQRRRRRRAGGAAKAVAAKPRKLSYKEQRELDGLPARIEALEREQKDLGALLASADLYAEDPPRAEAAQMALRPDRRRAAAALERWEALGATRSPSRPPRQLSVRRAGERRPCQAALRLHTGAATLRGVDFATGSIEYDVSFQAEPAFLGVYFHADDDNNAENFYLRVHKNGGWDSNQYMPVHPGSPDLADLFG